jgi:uncharacterized protein
MPSVLAVIEQGTSQEVPVMTSELTIDYEALHQTAMRSLVRSVLTQISKTGLPGEHHFYIAFNTSAPGTIVSKRLKEKYPDEMTIVLQHRFWELIVLDDRFEVKLTFDGIPERLIVPYTAIKVFFDPSVPYGLQFEDPDAADAGRTPQDKALRRAQDGSGERTGRTLTKSLAEKADKKKPARKSRPERVTDQPNKIEQDVHAGDDVVTTAQPGTSDLRDAKALTFTIVARADKASESATDADAATTAAKVVSLDAFRKK